MSTKDNIETNTNSEWDELKDKTVDESLKIVFDRMIAKAKEMCLWYWISIKSKKKASLTSRAFAVFLLILGTVFPILSAVCDEAKYKLLFTQGGVAMLVIAGLLTAADRIFGWSSGWMRYIQTVTSMENLVNVYKMTWNNYIVSKTTPLDRSDLKALFELTIVLQNELIKLLSDETSKWIVEFNASISLLESTIKAQRDESEKNLDAIRTNLAEKNKDEIEKKRAEQKAKENGAIQVNFSYKENKPINLKLKLDNSEPFDFLGISWAKLDVNPGDHILNIETKSDPVEKRLIVINVKPSEIAKETILIST